MTSFHRVSREVLIERSNRHPELHAGVHDLSVDRERARTVGMFGGRRRPAPRCLWVPPLTRHFGQGGEHFSVNGSSATNRSNRSDDEHAHVSLSGWQRLGPMCWDGFTSSPWHNCNIL
jgi:hypothetical protein